jgi:uncharacterized repeat protein (TIGR02543 family)
MSNFGSGSNSNGNFWYGNATNFPGFLYKKNLGVGGRRSTKMAPGGNTTCNSATDLYNKYKPGGGGVGASSTANRRAKNRLASVCGSSNKCFPCYNTLGQYSNYTHNPNGFVPCPGTINIISSSGSVTPTPTPTPPSTTYTLRYNSNIVQGGNGGSTATISYSGGSSVTILDKPSGFSATGKTFGGWNTSQYGIGIYYPVNGTLTMPYVNTILYAQWYSSPATLSVTYNANGGSSGNVPASGNYSRYQGVGPIPGNTGNLINGSFTFNGWNTQVNGLGTAYPGGSNGFTMPAENVILYAQWVNTSQTFTLTYNGNGNTGGSVPASTPPYPQGASASVAGQVVEKSGYTFLGWSLTQFGITTPYLENNSIVMNADTTLYAQWVGGISSKSCSGISKPSGSPVGAVTSSSTTNVYRDNANNTITIIIPAYFGNSESGPFNTGLGPTDSTGNGNLLSTYTVAILSKVGADYQINTTNITKWTGNTVVQTSQIIMSPTYWPTAQDVSQISIPLGGTATPAAFTFDANASPGPTFPLSAGGCQGGIQSNSAARTFNQIGGFYIIFNDNPQTTTRVVVGNEFRWSTASYAQPYTYINNYARVEVANGATPSPITGTFTPTASTGVNTA